MQARHWKGWHVFLQQQQQQQQQQLLLFACVAVIPLSPVSAESRKNPEAKMCTLDCARTKVVVFNSNSSLAELGEYRVPGDGQVTNLSRVCR